MAVCLQSLNIKGMMANHHLAKAVQDCTWFEYKRQLRYKALWSGKHYIEIDRWEATSKTCSHCGWVDRDLTQKDRVFHCQLIIDRDLNAAINIRIAGYKRPLRDTPDASALWRTLVETRGCRASAQCLSKKQEQEKVSPDLYFVGQITEAVS